MNEFTVRVPEGLTFEGLIENGEYVLVTADNRNEYTSILIENKLRRPIRTQLEALIRGFHSVFLKGRFSLEEFGQILIGNPQVDIQDLQRHTGFIGNTDESPHVTWVFGILEEFEQSHRAMFLKFITDLR